MQTDEKVECMSICLVKGAMEFGTMAYIALSGELYASVDCCSARLDSEDLKGGGRSGITFIS